MSDCAGSEFCLPPFSGASQHLKGHTITGLPISRENSTGITKFMDQLINPFVPDFPEKANSVLSQVSFQVPSLVSRLRICHAFRRRTRDALRLGPGNSQRCSCIGPFMAKNHTVQHFRPFYADLRHKKPSKLHCFVLERCIS